MHNVGTVPIFKMHNVGTVPTLKMYNIGTFPTFEMHNVGTLVFSVKLHSDLRILTQLELVRVGVDFVFPLEEERRRRRRRNYPHLAFSRRNAPTPLHV